MVRIVRRFLTTLFPDMPTTLDFRMFSEKDFIGYIPVMDDPKEPISIGEGLSVRHFLIMEDADGCSCFLAPSTALTLSYTTEDENEVEVKVVNVDNDEAEFDETMTPQAWVSRMKEIVSSYQT